MDFKEFPADEAYKFVEYNLVSAALTFSNNLGYHYDPTSIKLGDEVFETLAPEVQEYLNQPLRFQIKVGVKLGLIIAVYCDLKKGKL